MGLIIKGTIPRVPPFSHFPYDMTFGSPGSPRHIDLRAIGATPPAELMYVAGPNGHTKQKWVQRERMKRYTYTDISGQIMATSHDRFPPKGSV